MSDKPAYPVCKCPPWDTEHFIGCEWLQPVLPRDEYDKAYPQDERGKFDAALVEAYQPSKPCAKRIHTTPTTWCQLPDEHDGQCSGPFPRVLPENDTGPAASKRRRW